MSDSIIAALRVLLAPQPLGEGAIRLEDWNAWPDEQREAYVRLVGALKGTPDTATFGLPPSVLMFADKGA